MRNRHCYDEGIRYHRHGHRGPHFRSGWGPPWMGSGPRARRGDVRIAVLALLAEGPMHGYQIIQELESRSGGVWRPSPGSIYPTLQLLEDEDLVTSEEVSGKRVYSITDAGRARVEEEGNRKGGAPWSDAAEGAEEPTVKLRSAFFQLGAAAMQVAQTGSEDMVARTTEILTEARRRIYSFLAEGE